MSRNGPLSVEFQTVAPGELGVGGGWNVFPEPLK